MTVKERLQQVVSGMSEDEAAETLALVAGARAGATPTDIYHAYPFSVEAKSGRSSP